MEFNFNILLYTIFSALLTANVVCLPGSDLSINISKQDCSDWDLSVIFSHYLCCLNQANRWNYIREKLLVLIVTNETCITVYNVEVNESGKWVPHLGVRNSIGPIVIKMPRGVCWVVVLQFIYIYWIYFYIRLTQKRLSFKNIQP
jgi:hypothetical protein